MMWNLSFVYETLKADEEALYRTPPELYTKVYNYVYYSRIIIIFVFYSH